MRITPLDIYQKEFKRVLRGIDPDEVEEFLETVADDYEKLLKETVYILQENNHHESQHLLTDDVLQR